VHVNACQRVPEGSSSSPRVEFEGEGPHDPSDPSNQPIPSEMSRDIQQMWQANEGVKPPKPQDPLFDL
jgi:hypothetical protein